MRTSEALAARWFGLEHGAAHLQPGEKTWREKANDTLRVLDRPASGRNSALGRKVEQPGSESPAGPSGQSDRTRHDSKHGNK
jgi:hypothetical protein